MRSKPRYVFSYKLCIWKPDKNSIFDLETNMTLGLGHEVLTI